jgi:hypothetical protein
VTRFILILIVVAVAATACTNVQLIADYDVQVDRSATRLAKDMDRYLLNLKIMIDTPAAEYKYHQRFYRDYEVDLWATLRRARSHPQNEQTTRQLELMLDSLDALQAVHELSPLPEGQITVTRELFNQSWQAILTLEMAKKRGND